MKSEPRVCDCCPLGIQTVSVSVTGILAWGDRQEQTDNSHAVCSIDKLIFIQNVKCTRLTWSENKVRVNSIHCIANKAVVQWNEAEICKKNFPPFDTWQMPLMHMSLLLLPSLHGVPSVTASRIFSEKCSFTGRQCSSHGLTGRKKKEGFERAEKLTKQQQATKGTRQNST